MLSTSAIVPRRARAANPCASIATRRTAVSETSIARFYPRTTDAGGTLTDVRRFLVVCAVGLVAAWGLGWLLLMNDDDELPNDADAVVVLEGSGQSLPTGQALVGGGIAPTLVVSTSRNTTDKPRKALCAKPREGVICVVSGPFTTGGELQAIAKVARNQGLGQRWSSSRRAT